MNPRVPDEFPGPDAERVRESCSEPAWRQMNATRQVFKPERAIQVPFNKRKEWAEELDLGTVGDRFAGAAFAPAALPL